MASNYLESAWSFTVELGSELGFTLFARFTKTLPLAKEHSWQFLSTVVDTLS